MFLPYYRIVNPDFPKMTEHLKEASFYELDKKQSSSDKEYVKVYTSITNTIGEKHFNCQRFNPYTDMQSGYVMLGFRGKNHAFNLQTRFGKWLYWMFKSR